MQIFKEILKKHKTSILKLLFVITMVMFIVFSIKKEVESIDFLHTTMLLRDLSLSTNIILTLLGILGVASITIYDFLIIKHLEMEVRPLTIFNIAFIASAINNVSGLGGLTGATIRGVFFKKDESRKNIIKYNLLLVPATAIGLSVFSILVLILYNYAKLTVEKYKILLPILIGFILYLIIYYFIDILVFKFKKEKNNVNIGSSFLIKTKLLLASTLEWSIAFILFFTILKQFNYSIDIFKTFTVFTLASIAGIVSMMPGGVGSFDFIVLVGLQNFGMNSENILAALILYRLFYYIIPLILSIITTLIIQRISKENSIRIFNFDKLKGFITRTSGLTNFLLSILVFISGVVLLFSALVPGVAERIKLAAKLLSFPILQWSHQLSISIGVLLITISRDINMKVKRAYRITWWLLLLGAIFTFSKGFDYEEAIFLTIVLALLKLSKDSFYRKSLPFDWFWTLVTGIIALIGVVIYMRLSHVILIDFLNAHNFKMIFTKGFSGFKPSGIITYGSFIIFIVLKEFTKERITKDNRYEVVDEDRLNNFLENNKGNYLSHLIYLKDKHLYWCKSGKVILAYEKSHNIIIVLGDPIGDEKYFGEALDEFHDFTDEYGYKSVFYEVGEKLLPLYHEHGYYFFKLGEIALVDLEAFDIKSPKSRDFRNILSRFTRDNYIFQMINGRELDNILYEELKQVSDEWLKNRNEMGFSLGFFDRDYLEMSPIGIIKNTETNEIIAFASLMPKNDNESFSIDLMRFKVDVPNNTMAFLILNLIICLKEENYKILNLGMAPLSNVGIAQNAHLKEKMAHLFFKYGKELYSFGGLRSYKEKFNPNWESRYLAYDDLALLPSSIIEAVLLIHSKK